MRTPASPFIAGLEWGAVTLEGGRRFKDAKLFPGGAREWDWSETGTRHSPGVQPEDARELIEHGAEVIVLSRGQLGRLKVAPDTVRALEESGVEVLVRTTREAVELYNRLRTDTPVGALIHSTC